MDIMDEIAQSNHYNGGKSGFNRSDVNSVKRLMAEGYSCDEIARSVMIKRDVVEKFIKANTKKAKKKKDDDAS